MYYSRWRTRCNSQSGILATSSMHQFHPNTSLHYQTGERRSFTRRHKRLLVWTTIVILGACAISIAVQCWYGARQVALPFTTIDHQMVAGKTADQIAQLLQSTYNTAPLSMKVGDKTMTTSLVKAGITPDSTRVSRKVLEYPLWQRFVPFTLFKQVGHPYQVPALIDPERFSEFAKMVTPLCQVAPRDATVAVENKILVLTPGKSGTTCSAQSLRTQLKNVTLSRKGVMQTATLTPVAPTVSTAAAKQLLEHAKDIVNRHVQLQLLAKTYIPDAEMIASWLTFAPDPTTKQPTVAFANDKVAAYLATLQTAVYIAPGNTIIHTTDGRETSRDVGGSGRGIDMAMGVSQLQAQLLAGDGTVRLQTVALPPVINYNRVYSKTQAGLQALLDDLVSQKGDYGMSLRQIGGSGWTASSGGGKTYTTASTYKLFVAYAVLRRIEAGQMNWADGATASQTVSACFDNMIVNSDNTCAEWFGNKIGWKTITDMIHNVGLSSATSLYTRGGFVATPDDEALFLTKLQTGQLLSASSTDRLLGVMKRQIYRAGIPAGVASPVADKVGFLNGLLHDAAIVYAPSGTYVLVIMTNNSSWTNIADVARQINTQLQ